MTDYYWGPDDASVHFCEKKYEHSEFIGEYYNALTTFFYIFIGLLFVDSSLSKLGWITVILGINIHDIACNITLLWTVDG